MKKYLISIICVLVVIIIIEISFVLYLQDSKLNTLETTQIDISTKKEFIELEATEATEIKPTEIVISKTLETLETEDEIINTTESTTESITESYEETQPITESTESTESTELPTEISKSYTDEDLYILSHVIYGEASGRSWEHQIGVGSVVLNRVKDNRFPNTIKDVVFQKGQYACTRDGNYNKKPNQQAIDVAIYLLENGSQYPEYVIFQSQSKQGDSVYKKIGNTYFCYYSKDVS